MRDRRDWRHCPSGVCQLCGKWTKHLEQDHIKPKHLGGKHTIKNLQWICGRCHQKKTSLEMAAFHRLLPRTAIWRKRISDARIRWWASRTPSQLKLIGKKASLARKGSTHAPHSTATRKKMSVTHKKIWARRKAA